MKRCLSPRMIGVDATPSETIAYAAKYGFASCDLSVRAVGGERDSMEAVLERARLLRNEMEQARVSPGALGGLLPGTVSATDGDWDEAVRELDNRLSVAKELGFTRSTIVMLPFSETLPFDESFKLHVDRLRRVAGSLAEAGVRLGVEYVSQKTRRAGYPHEFVHDLAGTLMLLAEVGAPNVGVLLDAFHWFCARETVAQVKSLTNDSVVVVHVNDAIAGRPIDDQVAFERELPGASGEIDLGGFLNALRVIGYDGPVTAEPMNKELNAMEDTDALAALARSLSEIGV